MVLTYSVATHVFRWIGNSSDSAGDAFPVVERPAADAPRSWDLCLAAATFVKGIKRLSKSILICIVCHYPDKLQPACFHCF
jgi:hypothetical protein